MRSQELQIRVSIRKVNQTLNMHNFLILLPFFPTKYHIFVCHQTLAYFIHFSLTKVHFEENSIPYNFASSHKSKKCTIWKIWAQTLQVISKKSTKATFCQDLLHQYNIFKCKIDQKRNWSKHLGLSKRYKIIIMR